MGLLARGMVILLLLGITVSAVPDAAAADNDIRLNGTLGRQEFQALTRELGFAASYFPLAPAAPLGLIGIDAGVEVTAVDISQRSSFWQKAVSDATAPNMLVIPRLHVQKGLPLNIDIGVSYTAIPNTNISIIGGEVKWAVLSGNAILPAVALRVSGTKLYGGSEIGLETYGADISISKGIAFFTPYAGIGQVYVNSRTDSAAIRSVNGTDFRETENFTKGFVGLKIKPPILPFSLVGQADFGPIQAYSVRLNVSF